MRSGEVRRISTNGDVSEPVTGLPESYVMSQGGYFDTTLDPNFVSNQRAYLFFAHGTADANATRTLLGLLCEGIAGGVSGYLFYRLTCNLRATRAPNSGPLS